MRTTKQFTSIKTGGKNTVTLTDGAFSTHCDAAIYLHHGFGLAWLQLSKAEAILLANRYLKLKAFA